MKMSKNITVTEFTEGNGKVLNNEKILIIINLNKLITE